MTKDSAELAAQPMNKTSFGSRLKNARETLGIPQKDAARHLHLSENMIIMMEQEHYPLDLPVTFLRGYIRSYGKFLHIPEQEIERAIAPLHVRITDPKPLPIIKPLPSVETGDGYFLKVFTYLSFLTFVTLLVMWYYNSGKPSYAKLISGETTYTAQAPVVSDQAIHQLADAKMSIMTLINEQSPPKLVLNTPRSRPPVKVRANNHDEVIDLYN